MNQGEVFVRRDQMLLLVGLVEVSNVVKGYWLAVATHGTHVGSNQ